MIDPVFWSAASFFVISIMVLFVCVFWIVIHYQSRLIDVLVNSLESDEE